MGLDIYLLKPIKIQGQFDILEQIYDYLNDNSDATYAEFTSLDKFFEQLSSRFSEFVIKTKVGLYNFKKWFQNKNLNMEDFSISLIGNGVFEFTHQNGNVISINTSELETFIRDVDAIFFEEIGYQRYGMKDEFWSEVAKDCWYKTPKQDYDENVGLDFIFTEHDFENLIKKYCESDAPALNWNFKEGEMVIYLNY